MGLMACLWDSGLDGVFLWEFGLGKWGKRSTQERLLVSIWVGLGFGFDTSLLGRWEFVLLTLFSFEMLGVSGAIIVRGSGYKMSDVDKMSGVYKMCVLL